MCAAGRVEGGEATAAAAAAAYLQPSVDREAPSLLELVVSLPPSATSARLTVSYEKAFLYLPVSGERDTVAQHSESVVPVDLRPAHRLLREGLPLPSGEWRTRYSCAAH